MDSSKLKNIIESALLAAGRPLSIDQISALFGDSGGPDKKEIRDAISELHGEYEGRGIEIREVASGFRVQVRESMGQWLGKLWEERPPRYTRALMETLAIVAYRQPVTRGDIEEIRGVAVSANIIRTLLERDWIKVVGHRDVPGKPAMFGTTRFFLDYFGLKKLDDLPPLAELAELEPVSVQLELGTADQPRQTEADQDGAPDTVQEAAEQVPDDGGSPAESDGAAETLVAGDADAEAEAGVESAEPDGAVTAETAAADGGADDEEEDLEVTDEELAAAMAVADSVAQVVSAEGEGANVASLDDARVAAAREPETDFNAERAEVVPIKKS